MTPRQLLVDLARDWNIPLSDQQLDHFDRYAAELVRWNARTNLTTITDRYEIAVRHFLDSLALAQVWHDPPQSLADIGTGAGFPGVPLKILWPDLRLLLVESVGKKTEFLQHLVDTLQLENVGVRTARAEEIGHDPRYREQFAGVTARAVAQLSVLAEYCLPLCQNGGLFVAPKSGDGSQEVAAAHDAIDKLGGEVVNTLPIYLPNLPPRVLIVVRKLQPTPVQYPRRVGVPLKRPL